MSETMSFHCGTMWNYEHNFDKETRAKENHIDEKLIDENIILKSETLLQAYEKCFTDSIADYDEKQIQKKHPERCIGSAENYLNKLQKAYDAEKKRESQLKAGEKLGHHAIRPSYEVIIQVGDMNTEISREQQKEVLADMYKKFVEENQNFYVFGAVIHADEKTEDGRLSGVHLHIDYIPIAHCERGLEWQPQLARALFQQDKGFEGKHEKDTAQMRWQEHMRNSLTEVARNHGITIEHRHENREHLDREKNRIYQQNKDLEQKNKDMQKEISDNADRLDSARDALESVNKDLNKSRQELQQAQEKTFREPEVRRIFGKDYYLKEDVQTYLAQMKARDMEKNRELDKTARDRDTYAQALTKTADERDRARARLEHLQEKQWDKAYIIEQAKEIERANKEHEDFAQHSRTKTHDIDR